MSCLHYEQDELFIEKVSLRQIAETMGTPSYVYSRAAIEANWRAIDQAFAPHPHRICYAAKANGNIAILNLLAKLHSGFDIVSGGELARVLAAGGDPQKIIFSGVGKTAAEIEYAIKTGIFCFNVESAAELERLQTIADQCQKKINVALRVNPNVDPHTHSYISTGLKENKFGIDIHEVVPLCRQLKDKKSLNLIGIACHIGSQIVKLNPFLLAVDRLVETYKKLQALNISLQHINIGGGLGIIYRDEHPPSIVQYANAIKEKLAKYPVDIIIEPGRSVLGNAGILLTRIDYLKRTQQKNFAIVDAGMNDFLRPALYQAWQSILPVRKRSSIKKIYDIAGPLCESADFLGKDRELAIEEGDLLAIDTAGAYGFCMASNYNGRCRPAEILIDKDTVHLIRRREKIEELFASEEIPNLVMEQV